MSPFKVVSVLLLVCLTYREEHSGGPVVKFLSIITEPTGNREEGDSKSVESRVVP